MHFRIPRSVRVAWRRSRYLEKSNRIEKRVVYPELSPEILHDGEFFTIYHCTIRLGSLPTDPMRFNRSVERPIRICFVMKDANIYSFRFM